MSSIYKFKLNVKGSKKQGFLSPLDRVPIKVNRIFYIYKTPKNSKRGAHAYKNTEQVLICVSGSIKISCFDGFKETTYELNKLDEAIYISPKIWRTTFDHSEDAVILVLSSLEYDENDYIRDYEKFMEEIKCT